MTEIPVADSGSVRDTSERTTEIKIAAFLLIANGFVGMLAGAFGLAVWEDALSAIGFLVAVAALWVAKGIWDIQEWAWMWAVVINLAGIVLYLFSIVAFEGILLCIITLIYLNTPAVKEKFP